MLEDVPRGEFDALLREAGKYYSQAAELCREANMNSPAGGSTLEQAKDLTDHANILTQKAFGLMEDEKTNQA